MSFVGRGKDSRCWLRPARTRSAADWRIRFLSEKVVTFDFDEVGDFRSGMAIVVNARKVGYVDKLGRVVLPPTLDSGSEFTNGMAAAASASGSEFGIIDTSGKMLCRLPLK